MIKGKFRRFEPQPKTKQCSCGGNSKLAKRRNFTHGRKSTATTKAFYRCQDCGKETPISKKAAFSGFRK